MIPKNFDAYFAYIPENVREFLLKELDNIFEALEYFRKNITVDTGGTHYDRLYPGAYIAHDVVLGENVTIEPGAVIKGPTIIGNNVEIRAHAYIRGQVITGDNCVIGHCTEVIRSVLFDGVRLDHFNYVGDSILGNGVHFGAGAKVANLRFDAKDIIMDGVSTHMHKLGIIAGDNVQLGVNVSIGPGICIEKGTWIPSVDQRKSGIINRNNV